MFVLRMAGRELRASWRRLVFFFVCVAVGVGAIVALRSHANMNMLLLFSALVACVLSAADLENCHGIQDW